MKSVQSTVEVSIQNLNAGLAHWKKVLRSKNWAQDFHANLYRQQAEARAHGFDELWWYRTVDDLSRWQAIRPLRKSAVKESGIKTLAALDAAYAAVHKGSKDIADAEWANLAPLFDVAFQIKPTKSNSPVFASKLCHFISPSHFIVIDRAIVGLRGNYQEYWQACSKAWRQAKPIHGELCGVLEKAVPSKLDASFPFATKITELCIIGKRWTDA